MRIWFEDGYERHEPTAVIYKQGDDENSVEVVIAGATPYVYAAETRQIAADACQNATSELAAASRKNGDAAKARLAARNPFATETEIENGAAPVHAGSGNGDGDESDYW